MNARPDILLIGVDLWRWDAMAHLGNAGAQSPNLDRMAITDAVSFKSAFCQHPDHGASLTSVLSGWYPHVAGQRPWRGAVCDDESAPRRVPNLLQALKDAGYATWCAGPHQADGDRSCSTVYTPSEPPGSKWRMERQSDWRGEPGSRFYYSRYGGRLPHSAGRAYFYDDDWARVLGAIEFVQSYSSDKPLCVFINMMNPHPPYAADDPWFDVIDREVLPVRCPGPPGLNGKPAILRGLRERLNVDGLAEAEWNSIRAAYYSMCARVDHQCGLVLDAFRDTGRYDDATVFAFGLHGDYAGDFGLVETTGSAFEDVVTRVPLIFKPPSDAETRPGVRNAMVELVDIAATLYDITGIEPGCRLDGRSLMPLMSTGRDRHREVVFCEGGPAAGAIRPVMPDPADVSWPRLGLQCRDDGPYNSPAVMCRTDDFKYVRRLGEDDELYDLGADPGEEKNIAHERQYARTLGKMRDRLMDWYMATSDIA